MLSRHLKTQLNQQAAIATALGCMSRELNELATSEPTPENMDQISRISESLMYLVQSLHREQHIMHNLHVQITDTLDVKKIQIDIDIKGLTHHETSGS